MIIPIILGAGALLFVIAKAASGSKDSAQLPEAQLPGVTPPPAVPAAFTDLATNALAQGNVQKAEQLAKQADDRGLGTTAANIRNEVAATTGAPPQLTMSIGDVPRPPPSPSGRPILMRGSTGADVIEWQHVIGVKPDGVFGAATEATTKAWQTSHGLLADGKVGPKSWTLAYQAVPALAKTPPVASIAPITSSVIYQPAVTGQPYIARGSTGQAVKDWQTMLVTAGYPVTVDGQFGAGTETATKAFQASHGLTVDGKVGPQTWGAGAARVTSTAAVIKTAPPQLGPVTYVQPAARPGYTPPLVVNTAYPLIMRGSKGDAVRTWQGRLGLPQDGDFGANTEAATKRFQTAKGLTADGKVGPATWAASQRR